MAVLLILLLVLSYMRLMLAVDFLLKGLHEFKLCDSQ